MKRKLGKKNIRLFVLFSFLVLLVIGLFAYGIYTAFSYDKNIYTVSTGSFTYDKENSYVKLDDDGTLQQRWDKKFYLSTKGEDGKNKVSNLGNDVVLYNEKDMFIKVYGTNYRIDTNGDVTYSDGELEVSKNSSSLFYKLDDRKYLIVAKSITTENKEINTDSYLIVEIDKSGNALLLNYELNVKTLSTIILNTSAYQFDVANEKLIIPNSKRTIDLKKVSGSSNQYVEPSKEETATTDDSSNNNNNNNNSNNNNNGNNGDSNYYNGYNGYNGATGNGAASGSAASTIINNNTTNNTTNNNSNSNDLNIIKTAFITSVDTAASYIDVYYTVNDPKGEYISVFLDITGTDGYENRIILNKDLTRNRIRNLTSNTEYSIKFGYSYSSSENSDVILEDTSNSFVVKTTKNKTSLNITKINLAKKIIYYNITFDNSYAYDSAAVVVYSDGVVLGRDDVNVTAATRSGGYNGVIYCDSSFGYEVLLKLEDCKYDGEVVESNIQTKFING